MRNLPPRMSNQPARKAWEIEVPSGELSLSSNINKHQKKGLQGSIMAAPSRSQPHKNYLSRDQQLYDDTGTRIAYRGGWIGRGGRGWGG